MLSIKLCEPFHRQRFQWYKESGRCWFSHINDGSLQSVSLWNWATYWDFDSNYIWTWGHETLWLVPLQDDFSFNRGIHPSDIFHFFLETNPIGYRARPWSGWTCRRIPSSIKILACIVLDNGVPYLSTLAQSDEAKLCSTDCRFNRSVSFCHVCI